MIENRLKEKFDSLMPLTKKKFPTILTDLLKQANEIDNGDFSEEELYKRTEKLMNQANKVFDLDKKIRDLF